MNSGDPTYYSSSSNNLLSKFMKDKRLLGLGLLTVFSFLVGVNMLLQANKTQTYESKAATSTTVNVWPPFITQVLSEFPTNERVAAPGKKDPSSISDVKTHSGSGYSVKVGSDKAWGAFYLQNMLSTSVTLTFIQDCREDIVGFENCPGYVAGMTLTQLKTLKTTKNITLAGNQILSVYTGVNCWPYQLDIGSPFGHGRYIPPGGSCQTTPTATPTVKIPTGQASAIPPSSTATPTVPSGVPLSCLRMGITDSSIAINGSLTFTYYINADYYTSLASRTGYYYRMHKMSGSTDTLVVNSTFVPAGTGKYTDGDVVVPGAQYDPVKYRLEVSEDGKTWTSAPACEGSEPAPTAGYTTPTPVPLSCTGMKSVDLGGGRYQLSLTVDNLANGYYFYIERTDKTYNTGYFFTSATQAFPNIIVSGAGTYKGYVSRSGSTFSTSTACQFSLVATPTPTKSTPTPTTPTIPSVVSCSSVVKTNTPAIGAKGTLDANILVNGQTGKQMRVMRIDANGASTVLAGPAMIPATTSTIIATVPFTIGMVEALPVNYRVEVLNGTAWSTHPNCAFSYSSSTTPTPTPTKTPTPTPIPWKFLGCYSDPHCWAKSFSASTTPKWQTPPGTTYHPSWGAVKNSVMLTTPNHTLVFQIERYKTQALLNGTVIRDITVDGKLLNKSTSVSPYTYNDKNGSTEFVVMTQQQTCGTDSAGKVKHCQNPQVWWKVPGLSTDLLPQAYNDIIGRKLPIAK